MQRIQIAIERIRQHHVLIALLTATGPGRQARDHRRHVLAPFPQVQQQDTRAAVATDRQQSRCGEAGLGPQLLQFEGVGFILFVRVQPVQ
ncbi:hypothetical protein D3C76_1670400 [compost metagenome]